MISEQTFEKMKKMKMNHLAKILHDMEANESLASMSFSDRIGLLIDTEWDFRQNNKIEKLTLNAQFKDSKACVEGISYSPGRNIDKEMVFKLSTCDYIKARQDVLILGKTGVGKSYLAQALGNSACRNRISVRYVTLSDLFDDLAVGAVSGSLGETFDSFIKPSLLIIDDFLLVQPTMADIERLLKLVEKRMHIGSTIYCSQLEPAEWHERIEEKIIADAVLDRIINRSHIIRIEGDSMRKALKPEL
jgi:DNA replication protein DnaC